MTFPGWIDRIDGIDVEKNEGRRPGGQSYLRLAGSTRRVIWHTTEGSSVDGAVSTLKANFSCPHFVVGPGRIVQMRPLWAEAATVRGDNSIAWQVEVVGFSKEQLWLPDDATVRAFTSLLRFFADRLGVPLKRPSGWADNLSDFDTILAIEGNTRRKTRRAVSFEGHVMHLEWPDNTHWDQGAIRWTRLLELAEDDMTDAERRKLEVAWVRADAILDAVRDFLGGKNPPADAHPARVDMFRALKDAASRPQAGDHGHPNLAPLDAPLTLTRN